MSQNVATNYRNHLSSLLQHFRLILVALIAKLRVLRCPTLNVQAYKMSFSNGRK